MVKNIVVWTLIILFCITIASAESTYIVGEDAQISYAVRLNGGVIESATCNITILSPQKNIRYSQFAPMTYDATTKLHNYTLKADNITTEGDYCYTITCTYGGYNATGYDCITVTPSGRTASTAQSILYMFLLLITVGLFSFSMYWGFTIRGKNVRNSYNEVIEINWYKYLKIACWFISFFLFYFIIFLTQNIAFGFLNIPFVGRFYAFIGIVINTGIYVAIPLFVGYVLITYIADRKHQKNILEGIYKE